LFILTELGAAITSLAALSASSLPIITVSKRKRSINIFLE